MGISCVYAKALLLRLNKQSTWCSPRCHIDNCEECHSKRIPSVTVTGKLSVDETVAPPDQKRPAGGPSKKRRERSCHKKTNVQRLCQACGVKGHCASSCAAPSAEFRFNVFKERALAWCRGAESKMTPGLWLSMK